MATVTGMTAAAMQEIADGVVVDGEVNENGDLILTRHDGSWFNAGHVKGQKGDPATAKLLPGDGDTGTVDLSLTGSGTLEDPWLLKADLLFPPKLMQLDGGNVGGGPSYVTDPGWGLGTKYGPFDWDGKYDPVGNPLVRLEGRDGKYVITGHASGNSRGGLRQIPLSSTNNWYTYGLRNGAQFGPVSEYMEATLTPSGIVVLQGLYNARSAFGANVGVIGTLPPDMRPDTAMIFPANMADTIGGITIYPDGRVVSSVAIGAGQFVSLSCIAFPAAGVATWTPIPTANYLNGYSEWGDPTYGLARYWVDPYGVVWWAGVIKIGTATSGTGMFTIPAAIAQPDSHHVTVAGGSVTFTSIRMSGTVTAGAATGRADYLSGPPTTSWISLAGLTTLTPAALTTLNWNNINLMGLMGNGFAPYNAAPGLGNQMPMITKRPDGMCMSVGLVNTSAGTIGNPAFYLPERMLPSALLLQQAVSNQARARIDISGRIHDTPSKSRGFMMSQGTTPWLSVDNFKWMAGAATG